MTWPSFASRESTTLSIRWLQYGHFIRVPPSRRARSEVSPSRPAPPSWIRCRPDRGRSKRSLSRPSRRRDRGSEAGGLLLARQRAHARRAQTVPPREEQAEDDRRNVDDDGVIEEGRRRGQVRL